MTDPARRSYFFCGVGGSGMMPLAVYLARSGHKVSGSDRSFDQKKSLSKFAALVEAGITLFPQDGSGIDSDTDFLVVSSAVEDTIPDVRVAKERGLPIVTRGQLLATLFNAAQVRIAVAGTSGKSTVTGMTGTMLEGLGLDPTVINGGVIRNFMTGGAKDYFANVRSGRPDLFVAEMDESDGSIAHYTPTISVLNNIALDHKPIEELQDLFGSYLERTQGAVILNYEDPALRAIIPRLDGQQVLTYGFGEGCSLRASDLKYRPDGVDFDVLLKGERFPVRLSVPGRHNVLNALSALCVVVAMGADLQAAIQALEAFRGIHRRMEVVGTVRGITVLDDFAHNPDKISASLQSLKTFEGRLIVFYQQHGFKPLERMRKEFAEAFVSHLSRDDLVLMPDVYYAGGTVERTVTAADFIGDLKAQGLNAVWESTREELLDIIKREARPGDRVVIMGARDDTLHEFAHAALKALA